MDEICAETPDKKVSENNYYSPAAFGRAVIKILSKYTPLKTEITIYFFVFLKNMPACTHANGYQA